MGIKVTMLMAITLDGKIGKDSDHFPDWTGKEDKKLFVEMTKKAGVLIMGAKTYNTIGRPLPGRKNVIMTRSGEIMQKIGGEETPLFYKMFTGTKSEWVPVWDEEKERNLVITSCSPKAILEKLEKEGYSEVILAGGAQINTLFARENLIDELVVTVSPLIFGKGIGLFAEDIHLNLTLMEVGKISEEVIRLKYRVLKD